MKHQRNHELECHNARLVGLMGFFLARGHSQEEARDLAERSSRGENVSFNEPAEILDAEFVDQAQLPPARPHLLPEDIT